MCACPLQADEIYLKSGEVIEGKIVDKNPLTIKIQTDKRTRLIRQSDVDYFLQDEVFIEEDYVPPDINDVSPQTRLLVNQLIDITGLRETINKKIEDFINRAPLNRRVELRNIFDAEEILDKVIPIYAKHYTHNEMERLIDFYKSPLGRKVLQATPAISKESLQAILVYFQEKINH